MMKKIGVPARVESTDLYKKTWNGKWNYCFIDQLQYEFKGVGMCR